MAYLILLGLSAAILIPTVWETMGTRTRRELHRHDEATRQRLLRELAGHQPIRLVVDMWESVTVTPLRHAPQHDNTTRDTTRLQP